VQQKQRSDRAVTEKLSKLSVSDSVNEGKNDDDDEGVRREGQSDQPPNKKNKNSSRSRRRRKARHSDTGVTRQPDPGVSRHNDAGVTHHNDTGVSRQRDAGVTRQTDTGVTRGNDTGVTLHNDAGVTRHSDTGVSRHNDTGVSRQRDAGVTRHNDTGVTRHNDTGVTCQPDTGVSRQRETGVSANGSVACEFVRGGGGKVHSSSGRNVRGSAAAQRRDWFGVDKNNKNNSADIGDTPGSDVVAVARDTSDRKTCTPTTLTVDTSAKRGKPATATADSTVTARGKAAQDHRHSANVSGGSTDSGKVSASKDTSRDKRPVSARTNVVSASASDLSKSCNLQPVQKASGQLYLCVLCGVNYYLL